jgi:hypothetical protein
MTRDFSWIITFILGLGCVVGCGGDDENGKAAPGSTQVESGIPPETAAGSLTPDELGQLCDAIEASLTAAVEDPAVRDGLCRMSGVLVGQFAVLSGGDPEALCTQTYDACKQSGTQTSEGTCTAPSASCTASVGEIEQCLSDSFAALGQTLSAFPKCDALEGFDPSSTPMQDPASCQVVQEKCPQVLNNTPLSDMGLDDTGAGGTAGG